ncbi:MAG: phytoene/squalene synthetase [Bacteroidetes bacterium]|nr:MAG: phytoene/squalene synthetase [Bacteroidota bacterium]
MKTIFDQVSLRTSRQLTRTYSTSFSLAIRFLDRKIQAPVYAVYGFVRLADEIVDSFHDYDKAELLAGFRRDTFLALDRGISVNPVLNSFQEAANRYKIDRELIGAFLDSMEMDLHKQRYSQVEYEKYILGSAETVGLMCLHIFTDADKALYENLKPQAMKLGSAFQKINFLRDLCSDYNTLGRTYFPGTDIRTWDEATKRRVEEDIRADFSAAFDGILKLPRRSRFGVYVAYMYYYSLFRKIRSVPAQRVLQERIRIPNGRKYALFLGSYLRHSFNLL